MCFPVVDVILRFEELVVEVVVVPSSVAPFREVGWFAFDKVVVMPSWLLIVWPFVVAGLLLLVYLVVFLCLLRVSLLDSPAWWAVSSLELSCCEEAGWLSRCSGTTLYRYTCIVVV